MSKIRISQTGKGKVVIMDNADGGDSSDWMYLVGYLKNDADVKMLFLKGSYTLSESEEVLTALQANKSLECVTLRDSSIGNSLANVIDSLSQNENLNYLLLSILSEDQGVIDDAFMSSLASLITNNSGLRRLNLENISITNEKFSIICEALATTPYLKELILINTKLSSENRVQLVNALRANPGIKVSLDGCDKELETALDYNPHSFSHTLVSTNYPWLQDELGFMPRGSQSILLQSVKHKSHTQVKARLKSAHCTEDELLEVDHFGWTPLYLATYSADFPIMAEIVLSPLCTERVLLKLCGPDRGNVLHAAVRAALMYRNFDMMSIFYADSCSENVLAAQDCQGSTPLHLALQEAPEEIPMGDSDYNPLRIIAMIIPSPSCTEKVLLVQNHEGETSLHLAVKFAILTGYTDILKGIISLEGCTQRVLDLRNTKGETVLDMASASKKDEIISLLLSKRNSESNIVTAPSTNSSNHSQLPQATFSQVGGAAFFGAGAQSTQPTTQGPSKGCVLS